MTPPPGRVRVLVVTASTGMVTVLVEEPPLGPQDTHASHDGKRDGWEGLGWAATGSGERVEIVV